MKRFEYLLKNLLLHIFLFFRHRKTGGDLPNLKPDDKLLFIRLNRIGDALVTTALLKTVKDTTGCTVHILAGEKNYFVFKNVPEVDEVFTYRKGFSSLRTIIKTLNAQRYKIIVDTHDDVSTTVSFLISMIRAPFVFGLRKKNKKIFTHTVPKPDAVHVHIVERILALASLFGIPQEQYARGVFFTPSDTAKEKADDFIKKHFHPDKFILGINISAGSDARYWGTANYREFANHLKQFDIQLTLLSTTRDLKRAFHIFDERSAIYYTPVFEEFAAIMPHLDMLFSPDTSTIHLAAVHHVPIFGLYVQYKTNDMIWYPYGSDYDYLLTKRSDLSAIKPEEALEKFIPFLQKHLHR
jgi:ADP-heptose:LPS heptosyltransferase